MVDQKKISALPLASEVRDNDVFVGNQDGVTKRMAASSLLAYTLDALGDKADPTKGAQLVGWDGDTVGAQMDQSKKLASYAALRAYTGHATIVHITKSRIAGKFYLDAEDATSAEINGVLIVDALGRRWKRRWSGNIMVDWFEVDNTGASAVSAVLQVIADFSRTLNTVYLGSPWIEFGAGTFLHNTKLSTSANWIIPASAVLTGTTISYLAGGSSLNFDTSNLTGTVKRFFPADSRLTETIGDPAFNVQRFIGSKKPDGYGTLFSAEVHVSSDNACGGIYGSSYSSARNGNDLSTIGLTGVVVNDNKVTPKPAWCLYLEGHRDAGAGNIHCIESTSMNWGALRKDTPYGARNLYSSNGDSYNILINTGGSLTDEVNNTTAAIGISGKAVGKFDKGIIVKDGSIDTGEFTCLPTGYSYTWYGKDTSGKEFKTSSISSALAGNTASVAVTTYTSAGDPYAISLTKASISPQETFVTDLGTDSLRYKAIYAQSLQLNPTNSLQWTNAARLVGQVGQLVMSAYQTSSSTYATSVTLTPSAMSPDNATISSGTATRQWSDVRSVMGTFSGPLRIGQYTLGTLPSAAAFSGYEIDVTDAADGSKRCRSNGSVWQILNTTTTVS